MLVCFVNVCLLLLLLFVFFLAALSERLKMHILTGNGCDWAKIMHRQKCLLKIFFDRRWSLTGLKKLIEKSVQGLIYIFIHHNMIEKTEQKVQQKSTHKKKKITTLVIFAALWAVCGRPCNPQWCRCCHFL